MTIVRCSVNIAKAVRCDMHSCNGHCKVMDSRNTERVLTMSTRWYLVARKGDGRYEIKAIQALAKEMDVGVGTMKSAPNEHLLDHSYN